MNQIHSAQVEKGEVLHKSLPFLLTLGLSPAALAASPSPAKRGAPGVSRSVSVRAPTVREGTRRHKHAHGASKTKAKAKATRRAARGTTTTTSHHRAGAHKDDRFTGVRLQMKRQGTRSRGPLTVYVNGRGGQVHAGYESSKNNRSSIAWSQGYDSVTIPGFRGGAERWGAMMSCVREQFEHFDLRITDRRPAGDDYIMMMVGGRPDLLGYHGTVGGVAPYTGSVLRGTVGFVFSDAIGHNPTDVCETVAHEIGHTLGLDHTHECTDTMSYLHGCGAKSFQDESMRCGEWSVRGCSSGQSHQNSYRRLVALVGRKPATTPRPTTPRPQTPPKPQAPTDTTAPRVIITSPRNAASFDYGSILVIEFNARDASGLSAVELLWRANGQTTTYSCADLPEDRPIQCGRLGDEFVFALQVGSGERQYALRVTDQRGNVTKTRWRRASFAAPQQDPEPWVSQTGSDNDYSCS